MENKLLEQFESVIISQWPSKEITEDFAPLNHKELFELAYHTCNTISSRCISIHLSQDVNKGGSKAILYHSKQKRFTLIESLDEHLKIMMYSSEASTNEKLPIEIQPKLQERKNKFNSKDADFKEQLLKNILVERKLDEAANLSMLEAIARKVYFAIGDARESAAVVPMFMQAEGASLVQLALNRWMSFAQRLPPEQAYPQNHVAGLLKNLLEIKKWVLGLINSNLDK
ncbi:MAG: hypothetical protein ACFFAT_10810 [Promethearchaeota archaeon]